MRRLLTLAVTGASLVGASPALADSSAGWPVVFNNYCTVGSYRVCASSNVNLSADGKTLSIAFWNNERVDSYSDLYGQRSTMTAIGLYHDPAVNLALSAAPVFHADYYSAGSGSPLDVTSYWKLDDASIGTIAGVTLDTYTTTGTKKTTTSDTDVGTQGNRGGIVGCTDPTPGVNDHVSTCMDDSPRGFVLFTFGFADNIQSVYGADGLNLRFHAQQLSGAPGSIKCDTGVSTPGAPGACAPGTVTPEPVSMALLATGLLGIGVPVVRRRRGRLAV